MNTKFRSENLKGTEHLEDPGTDERIILKWILNTVGVWRQDSFGSGEGPVVRLLST
jgi:hypothetical protein